MISLNEAVPVVAGQVAPVNAVQVQEPAAETNGAVVCQASVSVTGAAMSEGPLFYYVSHYIVTLL